MSHFTRTDDWQLVNSFTIHHSQLKEDGRPFTTTCVPKTIHLKLRNLKVRCRAEWFGANSSPVTADELGELQKTATRERYVLETVILAEAELEDNITVFEVPGGAIETFDRIALVVISGTEAGRVGGLYNATPEGVEQFRQSLERFGYYETRSADVPENGWMVGEPADEEVRQSLERLGYYETKSADVPENGWMAGEPGRLYYADDICGMFRYDLEGQRYLGAQLYIDRDQFLTYCERILRSRAPVVAAEAGISVELFEYEVDASLSEPWHKHDYGLLYPEKRLSITTRARLDSLSIDFGFTTSSQATAAPSHNRGRELVSVVLSYVALAAVILLALMID